MLVGVIALLAIARPGFSKDIDLEASPLLQGEHCYEHSPHEVIRKLEQAGWYACETCMDHALSLYAERVRPIVDKRCPGAAKVRDDLVKAVAQFDRAIARVTDGNWFGHESARHSAYVEWMIIQAWRDASPNDRRKGYSHDDLATVIQMWYRTNVDADPAARPSPAEFADDVEAALAALAKAEQRCTPSQAQALRRQIMSRLARWL